MSQKDRQFGSNSTTVDDRGRTDTGTSRVDVAQDHYREMVEAFDALIYVCSPAYIVEYANPRLVERTGRNPVGEKCHKALHDLEEVCSWCVNERVFRGETVRWEIQSPKDNRWYYIVNVPIRCADGTVLKMSVIQDVTLRKKAEEALRESEDRYRQVVEHSPNAILSVNAGGFVLSWNGACERIIGYTKTEAVGRHLTDLALGADQAHRYAQIVEEVFRGTSLSLISLDFYCRDGSRRKMMSRAYPLMNHLGTIIECMLANTDVTEIRRVEDSLQLERSRLQAQLELHELADASMEAILDFALEEAVALTQSEVGYLSFLDETETVLTMHSWSKTGLQQCRTAQKPVVYPVETTGLWGEAVRQGKPIITNDYAAPTPGKKGYPEGHVHIDRHMNVPVFDGGKIVAVVGVGNKTEEYDDADVGRLSVLMQGMWRLIDRKRIQDELRESEEKFRTLFERAGDGIILMHAEGDRMGEIVSANSAAAAMHGYEVEEFLKLNMRDLDTPEEATRMKGFVNRILHGEVIRTGHWHRRKDGTVFPVELSTGLLEVRGCKYVLSINRDVTEQKEAERRIRASLKEKEVLLREIHHRVKNNLAVVHALLGIQGQYSADDFHRTMFEDSQNRIRSMALAHELLYQSEDLSEIDADAYLGSLVDHLAGPIPGIGTRIMLVKEIEDIRFDLDTALPVGLIVTELVSNSIKHAFPGETSGEVRVILGRLPGDAFELTVADNGVGMPTADGSHSAKSLGLDLVDTFVRQLHGEVVIESNKGVRAVIRFSRRTTAV